MIQFFLAFSGVAIFPLFSDQTQLGLFERRLKLDCFFVNCYWFCKETNSEDVVDCELIPLNTVEKLFFLG